MIRYPMVKSAFQVSSEEDFIEKHGSLKVYEVKRHLSSSEFDKLKCDACDAAVCEITFMDGKKVLADEWEVDGGLNRVKHVCKPKKQVNVN